MKSDCMGKLVDIFKLWQASRESGVCTHGRKTADKVECLFVPSPQ